MPHSLGSQLGDAALAWLGALDGDLVALARLPFDDADAGERRTWAYWPTERRGVSLSALDRTQVKLAQRLLAAALPEAASARAGVIMALEEVLDRIEGYRRSAHRHRDDYWVTVFGDPGSKEPWGWRFEGHHVSVHATVAGDDVALTPLFLGANPARVLDHGRTVSAPLAPEEALGFELVHELSSEQRSSAIVADHAPDDIVTRNQPSVDLVPGGGVPVSALVGAAARTATALLELYLNRIADGARRPDSDGARFAWAGATEPGIGHYYRIAGPRLLIELDNTQDGANHVHTVLRDPADDFGADLLARHYRSSHR